MTPSNWDKELAKIDRQLESISDEALLPSKDAKTPAQKAAVVEKQRTTTTMGVAVRLLLAVAVGVAMLFWPYSARCGTGLLAYLAAVGVLLTAGVWSGVWAWRHRSARGFLLSMGVIGWGVVLGAMEVLPRVGYAKPTPTHPAIWMCE